MNRCFHYYFYRDVWGLWGRSKLYMDLWWRGNQLHWICTTAPLWMWYRELLHTSCRWPIVHGRYIVFIAHHVSHMSKKKRKKHLGGQCILSVANLVQVLSKAVLQLLLEYCQVTRMTSVEIQYHEWIKW